MKYFEHLKNRIRPCGLEDFNKLQAKNYKNDDLFRTACEVVEEVLDRQLEYGLITLEEHTRRLTMLWRKKNHYDPFKKNTTW